MAEKFSREKGQIHFVTQRFGQPSDRPVVSSAPWDRPEGHASACSGRTEVRPSAREPVLDRKWEQRDHDQGDATRTSHRIPHFGGWRSVLFIYGPYSGGSGAAAKNRSGQAGIFGALLFEKSKKVGFVFSTVKNQPNSQISIADKRLTANEKTLFEQNASGKCQKCEYLTLLTVFARDKCCD